MNEPITIQSDALEAVVTPGRGAGILALYANRDGRRLPLMPDARAPECDLEWASFLMIPYSNRVEDGTFAFGGRTHRLRNGERHAIHGDVRERPWQVEAADAGRVRCAFRSTEHADVNWPWPFEAEAEYEVAGNVLSSHLTLSNRADEAFPAGFGWHPYYSRSLTRPGEPVEMRMAFAGVYPDERGNRIPSGPARPPEPDMDFSTLRLVDPDQFFDACACGYDGKGCIQWPESGVRLSYACSPNLGHLVLFNPTGKPYFAVEPVTNANNGFNLLAAGDPDSGVTVLQPGESLEARFDLRLEELPSA